MRIVLNKEEVKKIVVDHLTALKVIPTDEDVSIEIKNYSADYLSITVGTNMGGEQEKDSGKP